MSKHTFELNGATELQDFLTKAEKKVIPRAKVRATNRTIAHVKTHSLRGISKSAGVPQKHLRERFKIKKASVREPSGVLWIGTRGISAYRLGARKIAFGVKAGRHTIAGGFIAAVPNGYTQVFVRKTKKRLPILQQFIPLGADADAIVRQEMDKRAMPFYEKNFDHELTRLLEQEAKK